MITSNDMTYQVTTSLTDFAADYDVPAIVADLIAAHGLVSIDDIDTGQYWLTVERHVIRIDGSRTAEDARRARGVEPREIRPGVRLSGRIHPNSATGEENDMLEYLADYRAPLAKETHTLHVWARASDDLDSAIRLAIKSIGPHQDD